MWSEKFNRSEETLRLSIEGSFGVKISDEEFERIKRAYLLGRLDCLMEKESSVVSERYELYEVMQTVPATDPWNMAVATGGCSIQKK